MTPPPRGMDGPERDPRARIDAALGQTGWAVQGGGEMNLSACRAAAVREYPMKAGSGVGGRRVKDGLVDAVARSHRASLAEVLPWHSGGRVRELCAALGLDTDEPSPGNANFDGQRG